MTMLHVANLPIDATEEGLRAHFSTCGGVASVELLAESQSRRPRGLARVTMTNAHFAEQARSRLDGAAFQGAVLRVSDSPLKGAEREPKPSVRMMQQFRERGRMVYDLDCAGSPLTLRIWRGEEGAFRIEARSTDAEDAVVGTATAKTGAEALSEALRAWNSAATTTARATLDAEAVTRAMRDVRAI